MMPDDGGATSVSYRSLGRELDEARAKNAELFVEILAHYESTKVVDADVLTLTRERDELTQLLGAAMRLREDGYAREGRLRRWVSDLQSGLYVNCVYCGHRYGPGETTPASMADALKAHVERFPEHPMAALRAALEAVMRDYDDDASGYCCIRPETRDRVRALLQEAPAS
jgi:hypothetical protein